MVDPVGVALGVTLVVVVLAVHFAAGTDRTLPGDISGEVLERRAESVPETDFAEPMNRSVGGRGVSAGAVGGGEAGGELGEGEAGAEDAGPSAIPDDEAETFEVEYAKEGETVEVKENEHLLEAGEDEGWDLPYACREGQCLSCGGLVTDGPSEDYLTHDSQEMLSEDELDDGYTLTCVAYPTADLTLETNEAP
jgi:2Fe-2S type ferredoxin